MVCNAMKTAKFTIPANSEVLLSCDENFKFSIIGEKGQVIKKVPYVDAEKGAFLRVRDACSIETHSKGDVVSVVTDVSKALENLDVVPLESAVDMVPGMSLQDKMKSLIHDYAKNYFGDNQMDTLEEVLDVDFDGDGIIGTSEVPEMDPEFPELPTPPPEPPPPAPPPVVEPPAPEPVPSTPPSDPVP